MNELSSVYLVLLIHGLGGRLSVEGDGLKVRAPAEVLTADVRASLAAHKTEIIALLRGEPIKGVTHEHQ